MRNYIRFKTANVVYHQTQPNPQPPVTQYFVAPDDEILQQFVDQFTSALDPSFFAVDQVNFTGNIFVLLDKDNMFRIFNGVVGWWNLVGTDAVTTESPRKSWSHGH